MLFAQVFRFFSLLALLFISGLAYASDGGPVITVIDDVFRQPQVQLSLQDELVIEAAEGVAILHIQLIDQATGMIIYEADSPALPLAFDALQIGDYTMRATTMVQTVFCDIEVVE